MDFINFLRDYWQYISICIVLVFDIFILILKKRPRVVLSHSTLLGQVISLVNEAECKFINGSDKLNYVIEKFKSRNPNFVLDVQESIDSDPFCRTFSVDKMIANVVDFILNTPTKKGGPGREEGVNDGTKK